mgnify:CR=1 FL=1
MFKKVSLVGLRFKLIHASLGQRHDSFDESMPAPSRLRDHFS